MLRISGVRVPFPINHSFFDFYDNKLNVNPFHATGLSLYPLKTSKNLCFSDILDGLKWAKENSKRIVDNERPN